MKLDRELAKLVLAFGTADGIVKYHDAAQALRRFAWNNEPALRALAEGPPQLDGLPTVPGWYEYHVPDGTVDRGYVHDGEGELIVIFIPKGAGHLGYRAWVAEVPPGTWHGPLAEPEGPETQPRGRAGCRPADPTAT